MKLSLIIIGILVHFASLPVTLVAQDADRATPRQPESRQHENRERFRDGDKTPRREPRNKQKNADRPQRRFEDRNAMQPRERNFNRQPMGWPNEQQPGTPDARMQHLQQAIQHLRAAGLHEMAEQVAQQGHNQHRPDGGQQRNFSPGHGQGPDQRQDLSQIRREIDQIKRHLAELREGQREKPQN